MKLSLALALSSVIEADLSLLRGSLEAVRWCPRHPQAIRLHSLGNITNRHLIDDLDLCLSRLRWSSFPLALQQVFIDEPTFHKPLLLAGLQPSDALMQIHKRLSTELRNLGLTPSPKHFRPHLVLGSLLNVPPEKARLWVQQHNLFHSREMIVEQISLIEEFNLYKSEPHKVLATYPSINASEWIETPP